MGLLMRINTIRPATIEDLSTIEANIASIIPTTQTVLSEKFLLLIQFNIYLLKHPSSTVNLETYCLKMAKTTLEVSSADMTRLRKQFENVDTVFEASLGRIVLNGTGVIALDEKLTLLGMHKYYSSPTHVRALKKTIQERPIKYREVDFFSSIKIYDFYRNSLDKKKLFSNKDIKDALLGAQEKIRKLEVISIIEDENMHKVLEHLHDNYRDKVAIKHIVSSEAVYIPSVFFVLIKFKLKSSNSYKEYLFYLEPEINFGVASYANQNTSSGQFYELLNARFDSQFHNKSNIDFSVKDKTDVFEKSLQSIVFDIKNLLHGESDNFEKETEGLRSKIVSLKLHYPNMNYAYKLLGRLAKYAVSIASIFHETRNGKVLDNTAYLVGQMLEQELNGSFDNVLEQVRTEQLLMGKNVDLKKLRKSIFVNVVAYSDKSLCDIFSNLKWSDTKNILISLQAIESSEEYLRLFFSYFNVVQGSMPFKTMQDLFKGTVMEQIMNGEAISINNTSRLNII